MLSFMQSRIIFVFMYSTLFMNPDMSTLTKYYIIPGILSLVTTFVGVTAFIKK